MVLDLVTKNIKLNTSTVKSKRAEIREYFLKTYRLFEKQFEIFVDDRVFYERPEPLRHQIIFYFGHTATFYINKLICGKYISDRVNPSYESMFAIGVDEMSWDDLSSPCWPSVDEVREYRELVQQRVLEYIDSVEFSLPITWDSPIWVILMGVEHERIHIETSSVLHRQLDIDRVKEHEDFIICGKILKSYPKNELLEVKGLHVKLGKTEEDEEFYGWDNEYGELKEDVKDFKASKYLVSHGEFLEFVDEGGYSKDEFWSKEGQEWKSKTKREYPTFWIKKSNGYNYRALTKIIPLPLNWPVDVNYLEAEAFCRYKSKKLSKNIALPTEANYMCLRKRCDIQEEIDTPANINFKYFSSSAPVDIFEHNGFYDVAGNVWQWTSTPIYGFSGFKVHPLYDDFSVPTFDNKHHIIKGGSWASTGNEALGSSRYAFRKHFIQHAGFRYIETKKEDVKDELYYEKDEIISQYCEFHYGDRYLNIPNFLTEVAKISNKYAINKNRALDIGCSVGRASFELIKDFQSVTGIDFSARFISVAQSIKDSGVVRYEQKIEGDITRPKEIRLESLGLKNSDLEKLEFWQGDACNLKPHLKEYDLIIAINLLDRLYNPKLFLRDIAKRLNKDGIFIVASPFTWSEEYVKKEHWLGGKIEHNTKIYSQDSLSKILSDEFDLVDKPFEVEFVIQEHIRKYQHSFSQFSVWRKQTKSVK